MIPSSRYSSWTRHSKFMNMCIFLPRNDVSTVGCLVWVRWEVMSKIYGELFPSTKTVPCHSEQAYCVVPVVPQRTISSIRKCSQLFYADIALQGFASPLFSCIIIGVGSALQQPASYDLPMKCMIVIFRDLDLCTHTRGHSICMKFRILCVVLFRPTANLC